MDGPAPVCLSWAMVPRLPLMLPGLQEEEEEQQAKLARLGLGPRPPGSAGGEAAEEGRPHDRT